MTPGAGPDGGAHGDGDGDAAGRGDEGRLPDGLRHPRRRAPRRLHPHRHASRPQHPARAHGTHGGIKKLL